MNKNFDKIYCSSSNCCRCCFYMKFILDKFLTTFINFLFGYTEYVIIKINANKITVFLRKRKYSNRPNKIIKENKILET